MSHNVVRYSHVKINRGVHETVRHLPRADRRRLDSILKALRTRSIFDVIRSLNNAPARAAFRAGEWVAHLMETSAAVFALKDGIVHLVTVVRGFCVQLNDRLVRVIDTQQKVWQRAQAHQPFPISIRSRHRFGF